MNARLSFDAELESLSASLIRMGALATDAIDKAIEALEANDGALAQSVIAGDRNIDDMERSIEHQCLTLLLRQQPVAGDLRKISTAIKMITDIERIGDAAADIAEITTHIKEHGIPASLSDIADMAEAAQKMVDDSIQSYVREDLVLAADVIARDDVVDDYFNKIKKDTRTGCQRLRNSVRQSSDTSEEIMSGSSGPIKRAGRRSLHRPGALA